MILRHEARFRNHRKSPETTEATTPHCLALILASLASCDRLTRLKSKETQKMVKFDSDIFQETKFKIERKSVFWQVVFDVPEQVREFLPLSELGEICGEFLMGFYADPIPGDVINYKGHQWRVTERQFSPNRYRSRDRRQVPKLIVEYLRKIPIEY